MTGKERAAYLFLSLLQARTGSSYTSRLGDLSPLEFMNLNPDQIAGRVKMTERATGIFAALKAGFDPERLERELEAKGARGVTLADKDYPEPLVDIPDPPPALFVAGRIPEGPAVALVGSRKASPTGLDSARELGRALGERGVCVISGLALGIDAAAHEGVLAGGGTTVGVLGSGIDVANAPTDKPRAT
ncbi:MAG: DNA-processing protein DprA [Rubrobacteraceae bacterium]